MGRWARSERKLNHLKKFLLLFVCVAALTMIASISAYSEMSGPMFRRNASETVTISREEYERYLERYSKLETLIELTERYYYEDVDVDEMLDMAAMGLMAGVGDVYTIYYSKEDMEAFNEETTGQYAGIGLQLLADTTDYMITVTRVFKGSPAEAAGMRSGDKIVYVNDVYYTAQEMDAAVNVMRGTPGETVKVTVLRDLEQIDFEVMREVIDINYVEYEILNDNIGYVMVYDFLGNACEGFTEAIEAFRAADVSGMIIDLRNNGGGLVDACVEMADLILPEGVVVSTRDKAGETEEYTISGDYFDVPMVVLVNGYTASASEILAGAIRDYGAGTLLGTQTFGKGVVQGVINLIDGTGVKITMAQYFTPNGEYIHGVGLAPDVELELDEEIVTRYGINNIPHEQDNQLQKAIELLVSGEVK